MPIKGSVDRFAAQRPWSLMLAFLVALSVPASTNVVLRIMLEEPVAVEIHGGVGNQGWAVATDRIEHLLRRSRRV